MNFCCQHRCDRQRLLFGIFVLMLVGLAGWLFWSKGESARRFSAPKARMNFANDASRVEQVTGEAFASEQGNVSPTLTDEEKALISEIMAEAKRLLNGIEASNAKREMDMVKDGRHFIAVRVEAPTVEQLQPIYDLLSDAQKQFAADSEVGKIFHNQAGEFLNEIGRSDFKVVIQSTNVADGTAEFSVVKSKAKTTSVKYENGAVHVTGFFQAMTSHSGENKYDHLFPEP